VVAASRSNERDLMPLLRDAATTISAPSVTIHFTDHSGGFQQVIGVIAHLAGPDEAAEKHLDGGGEGNRQQRPDEAAEHPTKPPSTSDQNNMEKITVNG